MSRSSLPASESVPSATGTPAASQRSNGKRARPKNAWAPGQCAALATASAELLADAPRRLALGEAGRRRARERFSSDAWLDRLERVYAEVLTGRAGEAR
jgi:hypothetical protein